MRIRCIERASWRLLSDELLSPGPRTRDIRRGGTNKSHKMFVFFASAETRRRREESEKVRCSSAHACDQLDEAPQLPWKESTSGVLSRQCQNWFACVWPEGGKTCALASLSERARCWHSPDLNIGRGHRQMCADGAERERVTQWYSRAGNTTSKLVGRTCKSGHVPVRLFLFDPRKKRRRGGL